MKLITNPILGFDEYIPDGEPHVFNDRLYLFGSHDEKNGTRYCPGDFAAYSCPIDDPADWRFEGIIYRKDQDPANPDGSHDLYAPDVIQGYDGYYYLYYALNNKDEISVARCSSPAGKYTWYGNVRYPAGIDREALAYRPYSFDPGLFREDGHIYLAMGFSVSFPIPGLDLRPQNTKGAFITELDTDMLTMKCVPQFVIPGYGWDKGTSFEGHAFLEASSLRKYDGLYYFIYSSQLQHELCYAVSTGIYGPYEYKGVLISNAYENGLKNNWANNHGSLVRIRDRYLIFYHRHTCGTQYSRQACAEEISFRNGRFLTAQPTCQSLYGKPLPAGTYKAAAACFVYDGCEGRFIPFGAVPMDTARIDGEQIICITDSTVIFRYFANVRGVELALADTSEGTVQLYMKGQLCGQKALADSVCFDADQSDTDITLHFSTSSPVRFLTLTVR